MTASDGFSHLRDGAPDLTSRSMSRRSEHSGRLSLYLSACEREILKDAIIRHRGHNTDTARWLGVSRRTLYDKLRQYGLEGEASARRAEAGIMGPRKVDLPGIDRDDWDEDAAYA